MFERKPAGSFIVAVSLPHIGAQKPMVIGIGGSSDRLISRENEIVSALKSETDTL